MVVSGYLVLILLINGKVYFFKVGPDNPPCLTGNVLQQWYCLNPNW